MSWAVIVVPMFDPRMTGIDWTKDMSPALMNPTTSTVVTEDDWMTAVIPAPVRRPTKRFAVSFSRTALALSPTTSFSESVIKSMPNRNIARPPTSPTTRLNHLIESVVSTPSSTVARINGVNICKSRQEACNYTIRLRIRRRMTS